jgi:hypothetical protein
VRGLNSCSDFALSCPRVGSKTGRRSKAEVEKRNKRGRMINYMLRSQISSLLGRGVVHLTSSFLLAVMYSCFLLTQSLSAGSC